MGDMPNLNQILITKSLPVRHTDCATSSNPTHVKLIPIVFRNLYINSSLLLNGRNSIQSKKCEDPTVVSIK